MQVELEKRRSELKLKLLMCVGMSRALDQGSWLGWDTLLVKDLVRTVKAEQSQSQYNFYLKVLIVY